MEIFQDLVAEFEIQENVLSVALLGSAARGEMDAYSDLDVHVVVRAERPVDRVEYRGDRLLSINFMDTANRERALTNPTSALWNVLPARTAKVLHDPSGWYATYQARAQAFSWAQVAAKASEEVSGLLSGLAEEAHKVLGARADKNEEKALYATLGLAMGLTRIGALVHGALIPTENRYWSTVRDAEPDVLWRALLWQALGFAAEAPLDRATAALRLYVRSVELHAAHLSLKDASVAHRAKQLIALALEQS